MNPSTVADAQVTTPARSQKLRARSACQQTGQ
jgi:hypothetical protein